MKRTVAKVTHHGTYRVVYDDERTYEPYIIYREWHDIGKHIKRMGSCTNLASCLHFIAYAVAKA